MIALLAGMGVLSASTVSAAPSVQTATINSKPGYDAPGAPNYAMGVEVVNAGGIGEGTGVIVAQQGMGEWIATAYHVIQGASSVWVYSPAGGPFGDAHAATRTVYDASEDLALIYVPRFTGGFAPQIAAMPTAIDPGEADCVNGPAWTLQRQPLLLGPAYTASTANYPHIVTTAAPVIVSGCSGGPIMDYQGQLVGISLDVIYGSVVGDAYAPATEIQALLQEAH